MESNINIELKGKVIFYKTFLLCRFYFYSPNLNDSCTPIIENIKTNSVNGSPNPQHGGTKKMLALSDWV